VARTDWSESGWTNPVRMKCPKCKTVWQVSGKDAERQKATGQLELLRTVRLIDFLDLLAPLIGLPDERARATIRSARSTY
jgi:hypothetical protein